ncbi:sensor histidine kinase [Dyella sp.]|uniref:sensor histidine kinase n=1 Tax=Dyella sp. TaxID=1869338 RepID=UPI002ECFBAF3
MHRTSPRPGRPSVGRISTLGKHSPRDSVSTERNPLALRLHDEVGQWLALALLQVNGIPATDPEVQRTLDPLRASLDRAMQAIRDLLQGEETSASPCSLLAAIEQSLADCPWAEFPLESRLYPMLSDLPAAAAPLAPRAIRELVGNAHRHACATQIGLRAWQQGESLFVHVEDDGIGFNESDNGPNFGLRSLRRQVTEANGQLAFFARPGGGTLVTLELPLQPQVHASGEQVA